MSEGGRNLLVRGARLIDPSQGKDGLFDLRVAGGRVAEVGTGLKPGSESVVDGSGLVLAPGFIDVHVHLREPGEEHKETIASGTEAAAAGGFSTICTMPNTKPPIDNRGLVDFVLGKARLGGRVRVHPVAAITQGRKGELLSEIGELKRAGAVALSDDGDGVMNGDLMRRALEYAGMFDMPIMAHCEDKHLSAGGAMNAGFTSTVLGLPGIPKAAEEVQAARDLILSGATGARLHLTHVSTAGIIEMTRQAKTLGVKVTCDVTPHHLALTDEAVRGYRTEAKMNPPLRGPDDCEGLWQGLKDGTVDAIATDHAPHSVLEKEVEFTQAAFGVVGLETAFGVCHQELCVKRGWPLASLIEKLTSGPARCLGLDAGSLKPGSEADFVLVDPAASWTVDRTKFFSKGRNTPFQGWELKGRVLATYVGGLEVFREGRITAPERVFE